MQAEAIEDVAASLFGPDEFVLDLVLNRPLIDKASSTSSLRPDTLVA
jgi:hypothetical protein